MIGNDQFKALRIKKADSYFAEDLNGQRGWYSVNASKCKTISNRLSLLVLVCGALTSFTQIFSQLPQNPWFIPLLTGLLGMLVVIGQGAEQLGKYRESWLNYRKASEQMKRERRLYINAVSPYELDLGEEIAHQVFVIQIEKIIAEEQQIFWQNQESGNQQKKGSEDAAT